jgi:hypothetical protein
MKNTTGIYLLIVHGDVEPEVVGPFANDDMRDMSALALRKKHGDDTGIYMLSVDTETGKPSVEAYSGSFFD